MSPATGAQDLNIPILMDLLFQDATKTTFLHRHCARLRQRLILCVLFQIMKAATLAIILAQEASVLRERRYKMILNCYQKHILGYSCTKHLCFTTDMWGLHEDIWVCLVSSGRRSSL